MRRDDNRTAIAVGFPTFFGAASGVAGATAAGVGGTDPFGFDAAGGGVGATGGTALAKTESSSTKSISSSALVDAGAEGVTGGFDTGVTAAGV